MSSMVIAVRYFIIFLLGFFIGRIAMAVQYVFIKNSAKKKSLDAENDF